MTALVRMRLAGLVRTGMVLAPLLTALVALAALYGGGRARPAEAYGVSALVLFPVLAWQTKILLDVEPDVQRMLARVALGSGRREAGAGLLAAALAAVPVLLAALLVPWLFGALTLDGPGPGLVVSLGLGLWAHVLVLPPALALGAWASRVVTGNAARAVAVLAGGAVLTVVLGVRAGPLAWLAPPLLGVARLLARPVVEWRAVAGYTGWALLWAAVLLAGYTRLRRSRA